MCPQMFSAVSASRACDVSPRFCGYSKALAHFDAGQSFSRQPRNVFLRFDFRQLAQYIQCTNSISRQYSLQRSYPYNRCVEHSVYKRFDTLREPVVGRTAAPSSPGHHSSPFFFGLLLVCWPWRINGTPLFSCRYRSLQFSLQSANRYRRQAELNSSRPTKKLQLLPQESKPARAWNKVWRDAQKARGGRQLPARRHDSITATIINGYSI